MTNQNIVLPAIALRGTTILPGMIVHFDVSRERSVKAIEAAMLHDQKIFLVTQIDPEVESPDLAIKTVRMLSHIIKFWNVSKMPLMWNAVWKQAERIRFVCI